MQSSTGRQTQSLWRPHVVEPEDVTSLTPHSDRAREIVRGVVMLKVAFERAFTAHLDEVVKVPEWHPNARVRGQLVQTKLGLLEKTWGYGENAPGFHHASASLDALAKAARKFDGTDAAIDSVVLLVPMLLRFEALFTEAFRALEIEARVWVAPHWSRSARTLVKDKAERIRDRTWSQRANPANLWDVSQQLSALTALARKFDARALADERFS
jgi:hypothetical protein